MNRYMFKQDRQTTQSNVGVALVGRDFLSDTLIGGGGGGGGKDCFGLVVLVVASLARYLSLSLD